MNWPLYHYIISFFCVSYDSFWLEVYSVCLSMVIPDLFGCHLHRIYFFILLAYICPYIWNESPRQHIVGFVVFYYSATFYHSTREFNPFTFKVIADKKMAYYYHILNCFLVCCQLFCPFLFSLSSLFFIDLFAVIYFHSFLILFF